MLLHIPDLTESKSWACPECSATQDDEPDTDTIYECGNCGNSFSREQNEGTNLCPDCRHRAATREKGPVCPECGGGIMEEQTCDGCPDCDWKGEPDVTDAQAYLKHYLEEHADDIEITEEKEDA
jgi:DNA-directed RNA polymerase subunit RPC12/RpoP